MNKHLSILEHCYEYISNPSYNFIRENSTESYVPQIIKGMKTTISELMRQNRELELKLAFADRQKKKYVTKIKCTRRSSFISTMNVLASAFVFVRS